MSSYTHMTRPRDLNLCRREFAAWLGKAWQRMHPPDLAEITREYERAEHGLLDVACFCRRPAEVLVRVDLSRSGETVGLCVEHGNEARAAYRTLHSLAEMVEKATTPEKDGAA